MAESGLRLDEVAGVLARDKNRNLCNVLIELDTDLAEQERRIRLRRRRIAELVALENRPIFSNEDA